MPAMDIIVIGAGIVGAATARELQQHLPGRKILVLEKEAQCAQHQTGRNSGVIHAGVYYAPGSLKARLCRQGLDQTFAFCQQYNVPVARPGKLLVATDDRELTAMAVLAERARLNDLHIETLDQQQLKQRLPEVAGVGALWLSATGICDYRQMTHVLLGLFKDGGGDVIYGQNVQGITETGQGCQIHTQEQRFSCKVLVNCAGLYADHIIRAQGLKPDFQIVPFRGEYYALPAQKAKPIRHLVYPIPDPELPFLGVHLTPMIDGQVTVGPNAVFSAGRENYNKHQMNVREALTSLSFAGTWRMLWQHRNYIAREWRSSISRTAYLQKVQRYYPSLTLNDLTPYPSGIRAQAMLKDGTLLHDFHFEETPCSVHVGNAPSPAATSSLPIASMIAKKVIERLA
ncbi:L-2-hydroxyglutarate oxidase [Aestuariibacter halophilus]|uniref:L-2-hydroxyglutarate oxidase n=1 Tax=Fluctibacter halophilus TaxID=226011 RepID=A0ABS8G4L5_9ALTE|nr:L-2-hydroxyglutarate oxidase [Aestuariibacter halophilus]MCC2615475.1 L-2-hydroxyglutarate oxidase [Aestuariibacter halophilus]